MSSIQFATTELGAMRFFGKNGIDGKNLLEGWAFPEDNHTWNDGFEASLRLSLPRPPENACNLSVTVWPHLGASLTRQDITLYFNGFRVGFWRLEAMESVTLEAEIAPEYWFARQGVAFGKCTWHLPNSTKPSMLARTEDHRLLGLCFQSLALSAVPAAR